MRYSLFALFKYITILCFLIGFALYGELEIVLHRYSKTGAISRAELSIEWENKYILEMYYFPENLSSNTHVIINRGEIEPKPVWAIKVLERKIAGS